MKKKICALILILCILFIPYNIYAASTTQAKEPITLTKDCALQLSYASGENAFSDLDVKLYKIASVSADFQYTLLDPFSSTKLMLNGIQSQSEWNTVRSTLESFILANEIASDTAVSTDNDGVASFGGLSAGLYFVPAQTATLDGFRYYFQSALISLPGLLDDGTWNYSVSANPKPDVRPPSSDDPEYKVLKLWKGDDSENRPNQVTVDLIKDGAVVRTVTLSSENNWCYSWYAADDGSIWTVSEKNPPAEYTVTVEQNQTTFSIINSFEEEPDDPPKTGDTTHMSFYVLLLSIAGIVLLLLGIGRRKGTD